MAITHGYAAATSSAGDRSLAGPLHRGILLFAALCLCGLVVGLAFTQGDDALFGITDHSLTTTLFRSQDTLWFGLGILLIGYLAWMMRRPLPASLSRAIDRYWPVEPKPRRHAAAMALLVLILAAGGTLLVHHGHDPSAGDYPATFQARIFQDGRLLAPIVDEWADYAEALHPGAAFYDPASGLWGSDLLPVHAAIQAFLSFAGLGAFAGAIMTALSVVLVAAVARRLWPERRDTPIVAAALLVTAPQFVITGMTGSAWPAHLCLNLLWLWCYLRGDRRGHVLALLVGVTATGLHQAHVHMLFALPFVLVLVRDRHWRLFAVYAVAYAGGTFAWVQWHDIAVLTPAAALSGEAPTGIGGLVHGQHWSNLINPAGPALIGPSLLRLIAWLNLITVPLALVALRSWSEVPPVLRLLAWSCLASAAPYLILMQDQAAGWGYASLHGLLGNVALLAAYGWNRLSMDKPAVRERARRAMGASVAIMLLVALPLRALQAESLIGSGADALAHIRAMSSDVVLVDHPGIPFGRTLVRNDPFLGNRPKIMALQSLTPAQVETLCGRYSVAVVDYYDLVEFGVRAAPRQVMDRFALTGNDRALRAIATSPRCNAG